MTLQHYRASSILFLFPLTWQHFWTESKSTQKSKLHILLLFLNFPFALFFCVFQVMLAASYWSLLAPAIDMAEDSGKYGSFAFVPVAVGFTLGAAFVYFADLAMPFLVGTLTHTVFYVSWRAQKILLWWCECSRGWLILNVCLYVFTVTFQRLITTHGSKLLIIHEGKKKKWRTYCGVNVKNWVPCRNKQKHPLNLHRAYLNLKPWGLGQWG